MTMMDVVSNLAWAALTAGQSGAGAPLRARVLVVILLVVLVVLGGLVLLTLLRAAWNRSMHPSREGEPRRRGSGGARELTAWETAGRRAQAEDFEGDDEE